MDLQVSAPAAGAASKGQIHAFGRSVGTTRPRFVDSFVDRPGLLGHLLDAAGSVRVDSLDPVEVTLPRGGVDLGSAVAPAGCPRWTSVGGRPARLISDDDVVFIVTTATTRPTTLRCPFTHWSLRKLVEHLGRCHERQDVISRERLRQILREAGVSFQRTRTWKEPGAPDKDAKLDRIEEVTMVLVDLVLGVAQTAGLLPRGWTAGRFRALFERRRRDDDH